MGPLPERRDGNPDPGDASRLRVSDNDREKVADILRTAAGEGRLDFDELDARLEATYAAKTYADLVPITVDLPVAGVAPPAAPARPASRQVAPTSTTYPSSVAVMGDCKRQGAWLVPAQHSAFSLMGSVLLDLREATFEGREVAITANAIMGEVKVIVDAYTQVHVHGTPIMGDYGHGKDKAPAEFGPDSPSVTVSGIALMGSVQVVRLPPRGTRKKYLGSY